MATISEFDVEVKNLSIDRLIKYNNALVTLIEWDFLNNNTEIKKVWERIDKELKGREE